MVVEKYLTTPLALDQYGEEKLVVFIHKVECEVVNDQIIHIHDSRFDEEVSADATITKNLFDSEKEAIEFCKVNELPHVTESAYDETARIEELKRLWIDKI